MNNDNTIVYIMRFFGYFGLSLGLFLLILILFEYTGMQNAKNIQDVTRDEIHFGVCLDGEIPFTIGCFATKNSSVNSVVVSSDGYYLVPFGENYNQFIGFYTGFKQEEVERLYEESILYFEGEMQSAPKTMNMTGIVLPCMGKIKNYLLASMEGYSDEEYVMYYLYPVDKDMLLRQLGIIAVTLILGILCSVEANRQQNRQQLNLISEEKTKMIRKQKIIMFIVIFVLTAALCSYVFF